MKAEIKLITPQIASELLELNTNNRPITEGRIVEYANQMIEGDWKENGESIVITDLPRIGSGQHRLHAIIRSNMSFRFVLVSGIPDAYFPTFDTGRPRSSSNVLACSGMKNSVQLSATYHAIDSYKRGNVSAFHKNASTNQILKLAQEYGDVHEFILLAQKIRRYIGCGQALFAGALYWMNRYDRAKMLDFAEKMATGIDLELGAPELVLRKRVIDEQTKKARLLKHEYAALITVAINAKLRDRPIFSLKWNSETRFPLIGS